MVSEETLVLCMVIAATAGMILGFALGYCIKDRAHSKEIEAVYRIVRRVRDAKKEKAPDPEPFPTRSKPLASC